MSDDRFSPEQKAIDEAAKLRPQRCTGRLYRDGMGHACELGKGHAGHHRAPLVNGGNKYWWDPVPADEIEREARKYGPEGDG